MTHSLSLRKIIELSKPSIEKPKLYGLNQIKENIQDPVRLAVKEVLKAEREKTLNVQPPGPGHYSSVLEKHVSPTHAKSFSVKPGNFSSNQPRFPIHEQKAAVKNNR